MYTGIHQAILKLLDKFIDVCKKHNLEYFLDGGTLLGAVRKGKLIDWDTDADVVMPRESYNKMLEIADNEFLHPFKYQTSLNDNIFAVAPRLRLEGTTALSEREFRDVTHCQGIFIDIFPLDNAPTDREEVNDLIGFLRTIGKQSNAEKEHYLHSGYDMRSTFICINDVLTNVNDKNKNSKYVADLALYRYSNCMYKTISKQAYSEYYEYSFEGLRNTVRIPIGYEEILCCWYGYDWKIEKQDASGHSGIYYNADVDYHNYAGLTKEEFDRLPKL